MSPKVEDVVEHVVIEPKSDDARLSSRQDLEMEKETLMGLLGWTDDFPQEDEVAERGHKGWECTEADHGDKTILSCRRNLDPSPWAGRRKISLAYPHRGPAANK